MFVWQPDANSSGASAVPTKALHPQPLLAACLRCAYNIPSTVLGGAESAPPRIWLIHRAGAGVKRDSGLNGRPCRRRARITRLYYLSGFGANNMTRYGFLLSGLLAAFFAYLPSPVWADASTPVPQKIVTIEGITEYRLPNGLRVVLFPDPSSAKVTVNSTVFVGSRQEGYGETGMAHLLEHMVFKGTPTHPNVPKALRDRGAQFNGTTWVDRTNYFETLNATDDNLEFAIRIWRPTVSFNSYVKREDLLSEMTVVRNEFERGENSPHCILSQRMMAAAYRVAQLRQIHHRQPQRHRARADRRVCRRSTRSIISPITSSCSLRAISIRRRRFRLSSKYYGPIAKLTRVTAEALTPRSRRRTAKTTSRCAASAASAWPASFTTSPPRLTRTSRARSAGRDARLGTVRRLVQVAGGDEEGQRAFPPTRMRCTIPACLKWKPGGQEQHAGSRARRAYRCDGEPRRH